MYSLRFLFFVLPLYFSHVFMSFGWIIWESASFERQKMYFFLICLVVILAELAITRGRLFIQRLMQYTPMLLVFLALPLASLLFWWTDMDTYWIRGSYEKFHGYLLYSGIIILTFALSLQSAWEKKKLIYATLSGALIVSVTALIEASGVSVFFDRRADVWWGGLRTISTLGNPNYLAGYLLLCLPLARMIRSPERPILMLLIAAALVTTGSYIGMAIMGMYVVYVFLTWFFTRYFQNIDKKIPSILTIAIAIVWLAIWYALIPPDKLLSLTSRWVLMREAWTELVRYPLSLITGYGPESVLRFFMDSRTPIVDAYFPADSMIDSTHNTLLDILFQYGLLPISLVWWYIVRNHHDWHPHARESAILGIAFLMLNPYVVTHLILLSLTLTYHGEQK